MNKKELKMVIILLGPPGSGKGTQGQLLAEKFGLYYFETSRIGEEAIQRAKKGEYLIVDGKKYYFEDQKKKWERGELFDPPWITALAIKKFKELAKEGRGLVLSGSPRTLYEAEKEMPILIKLYGKKNIKIFHLEISPKETIFRNTHRRICQLFRHPILYLKENKNLKKCPLDGSKLVKRKRLDDPETIKVRLKEYKQRTLPLIQYFKKIGFKVIKINGSPPPATVFHSILKSL